MMPVFDLVEAKSPLIVSMPHSGTALSPGLKERLAPENLHLPDTDWHIPQLYNFVSDLDASVIRANYSRYVIDLNRDPSGVTLYPGLTTTGLVPLDPFHGPPLYLIDQEPDDAEIDQRKAEYFDPYHAALTDLIARVRERHGYAVLWDAHSINSYLPRLFEGTLHDLNLGTNSGQSCAPDIARFAVEVMEDQTAYSNVCNGRFKGGWITRHYGQPDEHVHALQMEIAQVTYMREAPPYAFDERGAEALRPVLKSMIQAVLDAAKALYAGETA